MAERGKKDGGAGNGDDFLTPLRTQEQSVVSKSVSQVSKEQADLRTYGSTS